MRDVITRSDMSPFNEIDPLSGWELSPLNPGSGQPVRHFASISELVAYAYYESPARKQLVVQLAKEHNLVILDPSALTDLTKQIMVSTIQILGEEEVLTQEQIADILGNFEADLDISFLDGEAPSDEEIAHLDEEFAGCTGNQDTCPICGPDSEPVPDEGFFGPRLVS